MKFDVMRASDVCAGRVGRDAPAPCAEATFDPQENAWVLEVKDLEQLMNRMLLWGCAVRLLQVDPSQGAPILELLDVDEQ